MTYSKRPFVLILPRLSVLVLLLTFFISCSDNEIEKKGFQVREITQDDEGNKVVGLPIDSLSFPTRPRNVLPTYHENFRLTPVYKLNYHKKSGEPFTGSNAFHGSWEFQGRNGNNWNNNFMPGFEAVYGYNFVNVSLHNKKLNQNHLLFDQHVLIKTLYYPSYSNDTLNHKQVERDFYMISAYDDDTNGDGFLSVKDLRRLYCFDLNGSNKRALIPKDHSVMNSEYDPANDRMYIFASKDINQNGQMDTEESINVFWIDLNNPENAGLIYK
jgi:hypothetical protein